MTTAMVDGRSYDIPDIWLAGFCQGNKCDVSVAIVWWDWQERIDAAGTWIDPPLSIPESVLR